MARRLKESVSWEGKGLHSGLECRVTLSPCDELSAAQGGVRAPVRELGLGGSSRGSDLIFPGGGKIRTVEHLMSAIRGLGLWGTMIEVEGGEIPALDGCSETFARGLFARSEEYEPQARLKPVEIHSPVYCEGANGAFVTAVPSEGFSLTYVIKYENGLIGTLLYDYGESGPEFYINEISCARTFALESDIELLRRNGMTLGGSLDNAVVVGESRVLANGGLRYADEFVRHKVLDLLGDLALVGRPIRARVFAALAGHAAHLRFVEKLRKIIAD